MVPLRADFFYSQALLIQLYLDNNDTATKALLRRSEDAGAKAIVFTIDAVAPGNRVRGRRFEPASGEYV